MIVRGLDERGEGGEGGQGGEIEEAFDLVGEGAAVAGDKAAGEGNGGRVVFEQVAEAGAAPARRGA